MIDFFSLFINENVFVKEDLPNVLTGLQGKVRLVVVHSLSALVKYETNVVYSGLAIASTLLQMARQWRFALVMTNQLATKVAPSMAFSPVITPALGTVWSSFVHTRILLEDIGFSAGNFYRLATVLKGSQPGFNAQTTMPSAQYRIVSGGFQSMPE